jgi:hypothetical protein
MDLTAATEVLVSAGLPSSTAMRRFGTRAEAMRFLSLALDEHTGRWIVAAWNVGHRIDWVAARTGSIAR